MLKKILILNTLKNQHILFPSDNADQIIDDLIGIQAQYINNAIFSIAIRSNTIPLIENDKIKKVWSLRGTLHLHTYRDANILRLLLSEEWYCRWGKYMSVVFDDTIRENLKHLVLQLINKGYNSRAMLREELSCRGYEAKVIENSLSSWGGILKDLNYDGVVCFNGCTSMDFCTERYNLSDYEYSVYIKEMLNRYFKSYGPATLSDFCYWMGITQTAGKQWFQMIEKDMEYIQDEKGKKYYYTAGLDTDLNHIPKCVFLSGFDPIMLAYKDKSRWIESRYINSVFSKNGFIKNVILINGEAQATWKMVNNKLEVKIFDSANSNIKDIINDNAAICLKQKINFIDYIA